MKSKRFFLWIAVLIPAALAGLLLLWADATRAQAPTAHPPSSILASPIVTGTDRMIWDAIGINPGDDKYPDVAYNSQDDEYLVVFEWEDVDGGSGRDLASIRVDANGQSTSPYSVARSNSYTDTRPAVAYNPTNNTYLAVWERSPGSDGAKDIYGAILSSSGALSGAEFVIASWEGDQQYPAVAYSAARDRHLVVWEDHWPSWTNRPDIYGVSVDGLGSISVTDYENITGADAPDAQIRPAVAANDANGRWLVAWSDSRNYGTTGYDIYAQQVYSNGTILLWGSQIHIGDFWGAAWAPDVAWGQVGSGDGEFLTVWSENSLIYGQRVLAGSILTGDVITVSTNYASSKNVPKLLKIQFSRGHPGHGPTQ